jgi:hypothetical protein
MSLMVEHTTTTTVVKEVMDRLLQMVFAHERSVLFRRQQRRGI